MRTRWGSICGFQVQPQMRKNVWCFKRKAVEVLFEALRYNPPMCRPTFCYMKPSPPGSGSISEPTHGNLGKAKRITWHVSSARWRRARSTLMPLTRSASYATASHGVFRSSSMLRAGGLTIEREICTAPCIVMAAVAKKTAAPNQFPRRSILLSYLKATCNSPKTVLSRTWIVPYLARLGIIPGSTYKGPLFSKPWLDIRTNSRRMMWSWSMQSIAQADDDDEEAEEANEAEEKGGGRWGEEEGMIQGARSLGPGAD